MASRRRRSSAGLGERAAKDRTPFRPSPLRGIGGRARVAVSRLFANVGADRRGGPGGWAEPWRATRGRALVAVRAQGSAGAPPRIGLHSVPAPSGGWGAARAEPGASYGDRRAIAWCAKAT